MKKLAKVLALALCVALSITAFTACVPSDTATAKEKLEKAGYRVISGDNIIRASKDDEFVNATYYDDANTAKEAYKKAKKDHDEGIKEAKEIIKEAKQKIKDLKKEIKDMEKNDKDDGSKLDMKRNALKIAESSLKKLEEELKKIEKMVIGRSGKVVFVGTRKAVSAFN